MTARLSDLVAPVWTHTLAGKTYQLKPLSLKTFAEAEGQGITLALLSRGKTETWVKLYCFLAGLDYGTEGERIVKDFMTNPLDLKQFQAYIHRAFGAEDKETLVQAKRRTVKNPIEERKKQTKSGEEEHDPESDDASYLVSLSRMAGIPLADLFAMTWRGIRAVQASFDQVPPNVGMNALGPLGLLGAIGGVGSSKARR